MQTTDELLAWLEENGPTLDEFDFDADYVFLSLDSMRPHRSCWIALYRYRLDDDEGQSNIWMDAGDTPSDALRNLVDRVNQLRGEGFTKARWKEECDAAYAKFPPGTLERIFGFPERK